MYDVAKQSGVSIGTVSRYVNSSGYVGESARARIQKAIDDLGYVPNGAARSLTTKRTRLIGLIVSDLGNPFTSELAKSVQSHADDLGYSAVVQSTDEDEGRALRGIAALRGHQVDGFVVAIPETPRIVKALVAATAAGIPIVLIGMRIEGHDLDRVSTDTYAGARLAMAHLLSLGHRRIGYVGGRGQAHGRRSAYVDALAQAGIAVEPDLQAETALTRDGGIEGAQALLALPERPTAIFAANDAVALGIYEVGYRMSLHIPNDLSVVGFDDIDLASHAVPALTTVSQPKLEMGQEAVRVLEHRLSEPRPSAPRETILTCRLVVRESTAPPR